MQKEKGRGCTTTTISYCSWSKEWCTGRRDELFDGIDNRKYVAEKVSQALIEKECKTSKNGRIMSKRFHARSAMRPKAKAEEHSRCSM